MLTPALSAIRLVLSPARPSLCRIRAVASKIASTVACEPARRGDLRWESRRFLLCILGAPHLCRVRVDKYELCSYNLTALRAPPLESPSMRNLLAIFGLWLLCGCT